ncbi:MAG: chemotaxis protein CheW [Spirochaetota bacterium]
MHKQYLQWEMQGQLYALAMEHCLDVQSELKIVEIPHSDEYIQGIVNWRGDIVTVLDLARLLQPTKKSNAIPPIIMRLQYQTEVLAIGVDEIHEVLDIDEAQIESSEMFLSGQKARYISSVIREKQDLLLVPDLEKIFSI